MTSINDSNQFPKLRTYKTFKTTFQLEPYLCSPSNPHHTLALVRFRISSHNLCIETGRATQPKTPEEDRLCIYCSDNAVEDEIHFMIDCPYYTNERFILMQEISNLIPNLTILNSHDKFVKVMSSKLPDVWKSVGKFIYKGFEKRSSLQTVTPPGRGIVGASATSGFPLSSLPE
jgi:hypothetical protein